MEQQYISIWNEALALDYRRFLQEIKNVFDIDPPIDFIHDLALTTQICIKPSKPLYVHGFVLRHCGSIVATIVTNNHF